MAHYIYISISISISISIYYIIIIIIIIITTIIITTISLHTMHTIPCMPCMPCIPCIIVIVLVSLLSPVPPWTLLHPWKEVVPDLGQGSPVRHSCQHMFTECCPGDSSKASCRLVWSRTKNTNTVENSTIRVARSLRRLLNAKTDMVMKK